MRYQTRETLKAFVVTVIIVAFIIAVAYGCRIQLREQEECNARGGVYVKQAFGYTCVSAHVPESR